MSRTSQHHAIVFGLLAAVGLWMSLSATAKTWTVERDGSADFTSIQPAIEAAAAGDTILIGSGRFTEHAPYQLGETNLDTYVGISVSRLALIGSGIDETIIGPTIPDFQPFEPRGIALGVGVAVATIENLAVVNVLTGIFSENESVLLTDVRFTGCETAIFVYGGPNSTVRRCIVEQCESGAKFLSGSDNVHILDSTFRQNILGNLTIGGSQGALVSNCDFRDGQAAVMFQTGATGTISSCSIRDVVLGVGVFRASNCDLENSTVTAFTEAIRVSDLGSEITGGGNLITGGSNSSIHLSTNGQADFHGNDIRKGAGPLVRADAYLISPTVNIDLVGNFWGTTDVDSLALWIVDGNDLHNPPLEPNYSNVLYQPFLLKSIPTRKQSLGGLKAMFGNPW